MTTGTYRNAFFAAAAVALLLAGGLAWTLLHRPHTAAPAADLFNPVIAAGPPVHSQAASQSATAAVSSSSATGASSLAPVQLSPGLLQQIGVTTAVVQRKDVRQTLQVPGNVDIDEQRLAYVQTRFPGWIQNVYANATWQYVRKGQPLFTIYSPDLVSTEQEYLLAKQNERAFATSAHGTAAQEGGWLLQAAADRLRQFDVPGAEIAALERTGKVRREIVVNSPATGYITARNALPNAYVQPDTKLYTIADLSTVWVYANVFQTDVGQLRPGDPAQVTVDAYPGRTFYGHIDQILPDVDPVTRTVRVRLIFRNPGLVLKPGMYVNVNIDVPLGSQMVIPSSGVLQAGTQEIAFIDRGQGRLEPRAIQTGALVGDSMIVLKGLKSGDRIVSSANFLIDSEAQLQAEFQPSSSASPATSASSPTEASATIALSTEPSPPRKGSNAVEVRLTGADGHPIAGAHVAVSFFMAAMPAMGMPAMHVNATLEDKGQGLYAAPVQLGSGGTWQVTVTAARNGQTLATQQLSVTATGGM
jgi:Cu(I)/Ag(I) efflux system membrane fusion protein/cobalt-zinc-cadmium efflux system membrane fusion protein